MSSNQHLDFLLRQWPYESDGPAVRMVKGYDGRDLIQVRLDLGVLQMEVKGRPDGTRPGEQDTMLTWLNHQELSQPEFELNDDICDEIDREFVQYYHRRIAWLRLQKFDEAVRDAEYTLGLMDFCKEHSTDEEWTEQHEQHRAFVIFHRTQAAVMSVMKNAKAKRAVKLIDVGLAEIRDCFEELGWEEFYETDDMVERLRELRESLCSDFSIPKSLEEQLREAVAAEKYELAAILRDKLAQKQV